MVHPVRAVGYGPGGIDYASLQALFANCRAPAGQSWICRPGHAHAGRFHHAPTLFASCCPKDEWICPGSRFKPQIWSDTPREWQPWSQVPPLIDRNVIRWPSDNWPLRQPPATPAPPHPQSLPPLVLWREIGGLLDMWA